MKDVNGREHEVGVMYYRGTAIVAYTMPMEIPISSRIILDTGEIRAKMVDLDFRGNKDLDNLIFKGLQDAILAKALPATSGTIFGLVHSNHGSNKLMPLYGATQEVMNKEWIKWSASIDSVLSGKLDERV